MLGMPKDNNLSFFKKGKEHLEKTHVMTLNSCDDSMKSQSKLQNLDAGHNFGGCCSNDNKANAPSPHHSNYKRVRKGRLLLLTKPFSHFTNFWEDKEER